MNIKASYRYQLMDNVKSVCIYYFIIICVFLFLSVLMTGTISSSDGSNSIQFNGLGMATVIFIFVTGLNSFKENFLMMVQNSVSRKTIFIGRSLTALSVAFVLATVDKVFLLIFKSLTFASKGDVYHASLYEQIYYHQTIGLGSFKLHAASYLFDILLYLFVIALGYFITLMFYRLNKVGKVLIGAGVPVFFFMVFPILDYVTTGGSIGAAFTKFIDFAFGISTRQPLSAMITCTIAFILFSGLSWLLLRNAPVKE